MESKLAPPITGRPTTVVDGKGIRKFRVVAGQYAGDYNIYWNADECRKHEGSDIRIWEWHGDTTPRDWEKGDWIEALDGHVVQLQGLKRVQDKMKRITWMCYFPMGMFSMKENRDGSYYWSRFYGLFVFRNRTSIGEWKGGAREGIRKRKFASLVIAGVELIHACRMSYPNMGHLTSNNMANKVKRLLMDEEVKNAMREELVPFKEKMMKQHNDDWIVTELDKFFTHVKKGSAAHLGGVKFIMEATGRMPGTKKGKDRDDVEEAEIIPDSFVDSEEKKGESD